MFLSITPILGAGTLPPFPQFDSGDLTLSIINILLYVSLTYIAPAYYFCWAVVKVVRNLPYLWRLLTPKNKTDFERDADRGVRSRLGTTLIHTSAQVLTVLRLTIVIAVGWRWCRMHVPANSLAIPNSALPWEPSLTIILGFSTLFYLFAIDLFRRSAERAQKEIQTKAFDAALTGPGSIWSRPLLDKFFAPAMVDVLYITIASFCLPSHTADTHLGLIVAVLSAWLFRNTIRIVYLWLGITICLGVQWYWTTYCDFGVHWSRADMALTELGRRPGLGQTPLVINKAYRERLYSTAVPRDLFWLLVCFLMYVMRSVRRETEDNVVFFHALAEAMPFDVFVKDRDCRFVFANKKLLRKFRRIPGNESLTVQSLQEKQDSDIGLEPEKVEYYRKIDVGILNGSIPYYEQLEPTYDKGPAIIWTIKVPVTATSHAVSKPAKPTHVLGLCRDPEADSDPFFYLDIVGSERRHCFFSKRDTRFVWGNAKFLEDVGRGALAEIVGRTDHDFYVPECADAYIVDDSHVLNGGELIKDEWHQPIRKSRRRVHVVKKVSYDHNGQPVGVRGYFRDVHAAYLRRAAMELLVGRHLRKLTEIVREAKPDAGRQELFCKAEDIIVRSLRALNIGDFELQMLAERKLGEVGRLSSDLVWDGMEMPNPYQALVDVCDTLRFLYPNLTFIAGTWNDAALPFVDPQWFKVAAFALGLTSALRLTEYQGAVDKVIHIKASRDGRSVIIVASDRLANIDFANTSPVDMAEFLREEVHEGKEYVASGLQIAHRVAVISCGALKVKPNEDDRGGAMFICEFFQPTKFEAQKLTPWRGLRC